MKTVDHLLKLKLEKRLDPYFIFQGPYSSKYDSLCYTFQCGLFLDPVTV